MNSLLEFRVSYDIRTMGKVDIIDKIILDSCKFISYSASEYDLVYGNLFLTASRVKTGFIVYGTQPIRIQNSLFPFFLFLAIEGGGREAYRNPSFSALLFSFYQVRCTAMFYSTQGSVQLQETGKSCTVLSSLDAYT